MTPPSQPGPQPGSELQHPFAAIFVISAATLLLELDLTRVFDVVLWSNLAYLFVSSAIFGFGIGAVLLMRPAFKAIPTTTVLVGASGIFFISVLLLVPAIGGTRADFDDLTVHPAAQLGLFAVLYLFLLIPFVAAGAMVSTLVTAASGRIHRLYFFDLVGAGLGCLGIFVLPTWFGAETTLLLIAAAGPVCAMLVSPPGAGRVVGAGGVLVLVILVFSVAGKLEFRSLADKITSSRLGDRTRAEVLEYSHWDPVSRIRVWGNAGNAWKRIEYDGGSQATFFVQVGQRVDSIRPTYFDTLNHTSRYNTGKYVALAHWLKRDSRYQALIVGAAGGQETLAALVWGAAHVDAVEMVCTVTALTKGRYDEYLGHIFTDPRVNSVCDEGRSYLRHEGRKYDLIQIHSNHTVSSAANGSGGALPSYLQTVEAYKEYFSHLTPDGILQISFWLYPRMVTTAAQAWSELFPGEAFGDHLVVVATERAMSTVMVKRSAWTAAEVDAIKYFVGPGIPDYKVYDLVYAPGNGAANRLPAEFLATPISPALLERLPYQASPRRDDQPFFRNVRKVLRQVAPDTAGYVPRETADYLNSGLRRFIPMESVHLYLLGGLSALIATLVLVIPILGAKRTVHRGPALWPALGYFASLGAGFIMIELVLLYKFVLIIGSPIYSMATVLFTLLVGAGLGSMASGWTGDRRRAGWIWILPTISGLLVLLTIGFPMVRDVALGLGQTARIIVSALVITPLAVTLGVPFPLGVALLNDREPSLIPWVWGVNAVMTVVGSLLAVVFSLQFGFTTSLMIAGGLYLVAFLCIRGLERVPLTAAGGAEPVRDGGHAGAGTLSIEHPGSPQ